MARPSSASNASRLATSTTLIPDAAIRRANSLPIPDEASVTSAHGPNCPLSSAAFIVLFLFCRLHLLLDRSVSQRADPIFQALYLHHHHVGVISGVVHPSHTLKSTRGNAYDATLCFGLEPIPKSISHSLTVAPMTSALSSCKE